MNIFQIVGKLYTDKTTEWIQKIDETEVQPFVIQHFLSMNDAIRVQVRWLDKYVFALPPKMYLSLAWSILPKSQRMPFTKYIKRAEEVEEFDFILQRVRKQFHLSDNDYKHNKERLLNYIKKDMINWFSHYGVPKKYWKKYYLDFNLIKKYGANEKPKANLAKWGI